MSLYNLGHVVGATGATGATGADGASVWNTSTAPTYANSKYTFTISNLSGRSGVTIAVNDIIFYDTYYYIVSTKNSTTVDCTTRVSIKGADGSSASVTIVDNLTSTSSTSALSAKQGKVLNDNKVETSAIATSWGSTLSDTKVPSEKLTKDTLDTKIAKSSTTGLVKNDGTIMTSGTGSTNYSAGNHTHSGYISTSSTTGLVKNDGTIDTTTYLSSLPSHTHYDADIDIYAPTDLTNIASLAGVLTSQLTTQQKVNTYIDLAFGSIDTALGNKVNTSNIVDNLTTNDATKVLSAKQGKALNDMIGSAITYINQ